MAGLKIVQVAITYTRSGTELILEELAVRAARDGAQVTAILPAIPALDGLDADLQKQGVTVERLGDPFSAQRNQLRTFAQYFSLFRKLRPDIAHFHIPWAPSGAETVAAAIAARVPKIWRTEHNPIVNPLSRLQRTKLRVIDAGVDGLVFVSQRNLERHRANGRTPACAQQVITNGISTESIQVLTGDERVRVRQELGFAEGQKVAAMVGNLELRKGPLDFVRAAAACGRGAAELLWVVVGDGPERKNAEQLARELKVDDRVRFLGRRNDIRKILSAFDIYVQPSHYEGLSIAMLEALAAGLPMATTSVDGVNDVLAGDCQALVTPEGDVPGLALGVVALANDATMRARLGAAGRRRVLAAFTSEAMYQQYAKLYASGSPRGAH